MKNYKVQKGTKVAPDKFHITVVANGPYLVFGKPPIREYFIMRNEEGYASHYKEGKEFSPAGEPAAICRCGHSKNSPFCDGSHMHAQWNPALTAPVDDEILDRAREYGGPMVSITDNDEFCVGAQFCDAGGSVWRLVESPTETAKELVIKECNNCPSGRLSAWDNKTGEPIEPALEPSIGLIGGGSDPRQGPVWVRGGIPVSKEDGSTYEVRNRVTLCRCGRSHNKPFCDGSHIER